jgi:hypothetical protein
MFRLYLKIPSAGNEMLSGFVKQSLELTDLLKTLLLFVAACLSALAPTVVHLDSSFGLAD